MRPLFKTGLAFLGLFALAGAWVLLSWKRWPDCLVDFGRELYVPWQINQGKVLYRDLYHYYGPLTQYFHAFLFRYFGASLDVLIIANFIILGTTAYMIYLLFKFLRDPSAGTIAVYLFLGIFAFGRYTDVGNYNFICPYSHELVDGFALSLAGILVLGHWLRQARQSHLPVIGLLLGLVFLTKVEVFIAFAGAVVLAAVLKNIYQRTHGLSTGKDILTIIFFACMAPGIFFLYMAHQTSFQEAWQALLQPWMMVGRMGRMDSVFYKSVSGFDDPLGNLAVVVGSAGHYVLIVLFLGAGARLISRIQRQNVRFLVLFLLGSAGIFIASRIPDTNVATITRGTPLVLAVFIVMRWYQFLKKPLSRDEAMKRTFQVVLAAYSLILTFKILLFVTPFHYGFVLAVPGFIFTALMLTHDAPFWAQGKFYDPKIFRALALLFLSGVVIVYFRWGAGYYGHINYKMARGADSFLAEDTNVTYRPVLVNSIVGWLQQNTAPRDSLVVMPEGAMINYLARRQDPVPVFEFAPSIVALLGEDRIIGMLEKSPPDYIVVIYRDMSEHGRKVKIFGVDYGQKIHRWVSDHYKLQFSWGELPGQVNDNTKVPLAYLMKRQAAP